jgi:AraC-like DNA-binding protein
LRVRHETLPGVRRKIEGRWTLLRGPERRTAEGGDVLQRGVLSAVATLDAPLSRAGPLKTGNESVDQIAARVGYADGVTLRTLLRRHLGYGIREIRRAN